MNRRAEPHFKQTDRTAAGSIPGGRHFKMPPRALPRRPDDAAFDWLAVELLDAVLARMTIIGDRLVIDGGHGLTDMLLDYRSLSPAMAAAEIFGVEARA